MSDTHSNYHLRKERQRADQTIKRERSRADQVFGADVDRIRAGERIRSERDLSDRDLAHERQKTDIGMEDSDRAFADELAAHESTRSELTTRDEFLAIVSHDLKNPIGTMAAAAELILTDPGPAKVTQYAEMITRNAHIALRLINDLLDMERISAGKFELEIKTHPLHSLIRETVKSFQHSSQSKSINLEYVHGDDISISCDADRIVQLLSNLISNAVKFTPEGGRISVEALIKDGDVQVSVSDSGPGIPEDQRERIFDRFSQLHKSDRRGLGLGLYISSKIIAAHRGRLWVVSNPGKGSRFFFSLPTTA